MRRLDALRLVQRIADCREVLPRLVGTVPAPHLLRERLNRGVDAVPVVRLGVWRAVLLLSALASLLAIPFEWHDTMVIEE